MLCSNCASLAIKTGNKKCRNCKSDIYDNLSVICSACSSRDLVCSVCLKKVYLNSAPRQTLGSGCKACRRK